MKSRLLLGSLPILSLYAGLAYAEPEAPAMEPLIAEAKTIIQEFAARLQGELGTAIQSGGPVAAIEVCRDRAPAIAESLSAESGWQVARTSLKPRNIKTGTPDAWEAEVLKEFDARQAAGQDVMAMAHAEVIEDEDGKRFRFMKAVPTAAICLKCHGAALDPQIAEALDEAYPQDQARGYQEGKVRGAFSLEKPL